MKFVQRKHKSMALADGRKLAAELGPMWEAEAALRCRQEGSIVWGHEYRWEGHARTKDGRLRMWVDYGDKYQARSTVAPFVRSGPCDTPREALDVVAEKLAKLASDVGDHQVTMDRALLAPPRPEPEE